jgi:hypothetical protein
VIDDALRINQIMFADIVLLGDNALAIGVAAAVTLLSSTRIAAILKSGDTICADGVQVRLITKPWSVPKSCRAVFTGQHIANKVRA